MICLYYGNGLFFFVLSLCSLFDMLSPEILTFISEVEKCFEYRRMFPSVRIEKVWRLGDTVLLSVHR